ncbi:MAG TPA: XRE family transcriptional regulator [Lachnospiraceae bacterium]|jgi:transcriptional regulator with XRE-family HTH domain|nr:XRE family transcriptional regulator [Lachnospiraceae bacterium]
MKISIKGARVEKGMTQKQAGDAMNVTKETISNWERGITAPTAPQLLKLCDVYGVSVADIFLH